MQQGKLKKSGKLMKIADIEEKNPSYFLNDLKNFNGKMWIMIMLKITKKQGFVLSLESRLLEKPQGVSKWLPSVFRIKLQCFPGNFRRHFRIVILKINFEHWPPKYRSNHPEMRLRHRCFPVNFAKFLRETIL